MREWDRAQANAVGLDAMGDPRAEWQRWIAWSREQPTEYKAVVRDCTATAGSEAKPPEKAMLAHACEQSEKHFPSNKALAKQQKRAHGYRKPVAAVLAPDSTVCPICSRVFASHRQLLDHAQYRAKRCRAALLQA